MSLRVLENDCASAALCPKCSSLHQSRLGGPPPSDMVWGFLEKSVGLVVAQGARLTAQMPNELCVSSVRGFPLPSPLSSLCSGPLPAPQVPHKHLPLLWREPVLRAKREARSSSPAPSGMTFEHPAPGIFHPLRAVRGVAFSSQSLLRFQGG